MTKLLCPTGPRLVPDGAPAFVAPPDLAEILKIEGSPPPRFFKQPFRRIQMEYRTAFGAGFMASPLLAVAMLQGRVIVEVLGQWVIGVRQ